MAAAAAPAGAGVPNALARRLLRMADVVLNPSPVPPATPADQLRYQTPRGLVFFSLKYKVGGFSLKLYFAVSRVYLQSVSYKIHFFLRILVYPGVFIGILSMSQGYICRKCILMYFDVS